MQMCQILSSVNGHIATPPFFVDIHLNSTMSPSVTLLPLLYPKTPRNGCAQSKSPSLCHISLSYIVGFNINNNPPNNSKSHACTRHVVIIAIIAMLTLCYSIMPHATLILYRHASITCKKHGKKEPQSFSHCGYFDHPICSH